MLGLTILGAFHTAISLVAVVAGFWAFARDKQILPANRLGQLYLATTAITAATGLMIFQHGGFRTGHKVAILTLVALAIGTVAAKSRLFGRASLYVQAAGYSITMLFHLIAGTAETLTRLPPDGPLVTAANAFIFTDIISGLTLVFVIGLAVQWRLIHKRYGTDIPR
jgi:uncharacterized membrane protein